MPYTVWLGLAMLAVALANTVLMAWLWRFPMVPDPGGPNPHGRTTAPRAGLLLHRALGWSFVLLYLALLPAMLPRLWLYREWSAWSLLHAGAGLGVGVVMAAKILILRRLRRLEGRMPLIGGTLAALTVLAVLLALLPLWRVAGGPRAPADPAAAAGREALLRYCRQCHGASVVADEDGGPGDWHELTREMQRRAARDPRRMPIPEAARHAAAVWLAQVRGDDDEFREERDDEDGGGRRRRRRRGRDREEDGDDDD